MIVVNQLCKFRDTKVRVARINHTRDIARIHEQWSLDTTEVHTNTLTPLFDTVSVFGEKITVQKPGVSLEVAQRMADKLMRDHYRDRAVTYRAQPTLVGVAND